MKVIGSAGREDIAIVYLSQLDDGNLIEFVESVQPPIPREKKWVLIVSSMVGCPVNCMFCDAGGDYRRKLSKDEIIQQIDYMVKRRYGDRKVPVRKFKIQFARIGESSMNEDVIYVLEKLPSLYDAPGLTPCISTVAPKGRDVFFEELITVKNRLYTGGRSQLQFSIHTTDEGLRDKIIPVKKWNFEEIAEYGRNYFEKGDRKITLNFALARDYPLEPDVLKEYFEPARFLIKITPVNPTVRAMERGIKSVVEKSPDEIDGLVSKLKKEGYDVIVSIGELEENKIGSNCGQLIRRYLESKISIGNSYTYELFLPF